MTNLDSIFKSRDITLPAKVRLVKAMVFPVVMYSCESWTVKKAECQRIDAFGLWCWRRLLRVPWTARRSNQSILKEISSGCLLEGLMLKLKLQYSCLENSMDGRAGWATVHGVAKLNTAEQLHFTTPWKKSYDKPRQCIKKQRHYFAKKVHISQSYGFSSSHVCM